MAIAAVRPITLSTPYYLNLFAKETKYEFLKSMRNRMYSLATLGFPIMFYLLFGVSNRHAGPGLNYAQYLVAGYSCFGMIAAALFNLGAGIATERAQGWLELKQASPMPGLAYLGAKVLTCMLFGIVIVTALVTLGVLLGRRAHYARADRASWSRRYRGIHSLRQSWHGAFSADFT